jgi:hypothetical protein
MTAMVNGDDLIRAGERENLEVPDIAAGRPRMQKNDRRPFSVGIEEDFDSAIISVGHRNHLTNIGRFDERSSECAGN